MAERPGAGIGVLGSAFNPPHLGHLALAQEALWQLDLAEVILVPTGVAPHKRIADDPGKELRMTMTRLAAADDSRFSVSALEVEREGPSYTYETLELLAEERGESDLVFVMGADAAVGLESWREPERVVGLARLAVARQGWHLRCRGRRGDAQSRCRGAGDDARDAPIRCLFLSSSRARRSRPAAPLSGTRAGRAIHRGEGDLRLNPMQSENLARRLAELADSKKAEDIVVLDMRGLVAYTDFLAICTARNERQARAIVDEVRLRVKQESALLPGGVDGGGEAGWTIVDYLDAVLHVFTPEARDRYQLDDLWHEAPRLEIDFEAPEAPSAAAGA